MVGTMPLLGELRLHQRDQRVAAPGAQHLAFERGVGEARQHTGDADDDQSLDQGEAMAGTRRDECLHGSLLWKFQQARQPGTPVGVHERTRPMTLTT